MNAAKAVGAEKTAEDKVATGSTSEAQIKPKLKKKVVISDPFASDDETDKPASKQESVKAKGKKPMLKKKSAADPFASDDEDEDEEARKQVLKAKKASAGKKRSRDESEEDEDPRSSKTLKTRRG